MAGGDVPTSLLLDSAIKMAKDETSVHELNEDLGQGSWTHGDGWGLAYLDGTTWVVEKSTKAIYHDPKVDDLRNIKTNLAIIHVRKKMGSKVHYKNTHPFKFKKKGLGNFAFCHNGYIEEEIDYSSSFSTKGETDSEQLFYAILTKIQEKKPVESIRETLERYNKCTGTNVILATKEISYIGTRENKFPAYYHMKVAQTKDMILVGSEMLSEYADLDWQSINYGDILTIDNERLTFQVDKKPIIAKMN